MMEMLFVNEKTALGRMVKAYEAKGFSVVNAPRPLAGLGTWQGEWHHGRFYAWGLLADDPARGAIEGHGFAKSWSADDAYLLCAVSDAEIEEQIYVLETASGYRTRALIDDYLRDYTEMGMDGWKHFANTHNLPHSHAFSEDEKRQLGWED